MKVVKHLSYAWSGCGNHPMWVRSLNHCTRQGLHSAPSSDPLTSAAARPLIFVLSPPLGRGNEVDRYFYSPFGVMEGVYAALLTNAASYGYPLAIYQCPAMAAFLASNPMATIRPFAEVPATIIARGRELMLS